MDCKVFILILFILPLIESRNIRESKDATDDEQLRNIIERLAKSVESLARVVGSEQQEHLVTGDEGTTFAPNVIPKSTPPPPPSPPIPLPLLPTSNSTTSTINQSG